ncbi:hypothetical protein GXP67_15465 [Rhodocytophaga rosea]|uniref:Uncharacterized protein n=1 Tax=Rhodocytophaga rosea TaxID=2704465 RepID=A0A6C0GJ35_9BACT|nr:hypothetical protein [Rhodocytophaga rosea]QHT67937.1 hypothetical protein GXP67_15465 [Rhodocytophaga rosea]
MTEKKLRKIIALAIVVGAIMALFDMAYGTTILLGGLAAFLLLKLIKLIAKKKYTWTTLHVVQLIFILIALASLALRYYEYPYGRVVFIIAFLAESLVSAKIMLNEKFGNDNVNNFFRMVKQFLLAQRQGSRRI